MNIVCIQYVLLLFTVAPQNLISSPDDKQRINSPTTFTPYFGWINDPTHLLCACEYYIIGYQYNNYSNHVGNISWGQAVSKDLVNWTETGVVIPYNPHTKEQRFTGTGILDKKNSSGLSKGNNSVIVAFTNNFGQKTILHDGSTVEAGTQSQYLAIFDCPHLRQFYRLYKDNPTVKYPPSQYANQSQNFRDPFLLWYKPHKKWIMVLVLADLFKALIYCSDNLIDWTYLSEFSSNLSPRYQWECPGLFQVRVLNSNKRKWVLLISTNPGEKVKGPGINPNRSATGSCVHYHVGDFDGHKFTEIKNKDGYVKYLDEGSALYATNVFNNVGNRTLLMGWVNNWEYAPNRTEVYKGGLGFVREIFLLIINGVYRLIQRPIPELNKYVTQINCYTQSQMEEGVPVEIIKKQSHKFFITINGTANFVFVLGEYRQNNEQARIYNDHKNKTVCIRMKSVNPSKNGALVNHCAEYTAGRITTLTLIVDIHTLTAIFDEGWPTFTELVQPIFEKRRFKLAQRSSVSISVCHSILTIH